MDILRVPLEFGTPGCSHPFSELISHAAGLCGCTNSQIDWVKVRAFIAYWLLSWPPSAFPLSCAGSRLKKGYMA